ncbi:MAG: ATP-binding protein [Thermoanaerobaculia bacterium]
MTEQHLALIVPREIAALADITKMVERFYAAHPAAAETRYPVELALEEIFTNMVRHNSAGKGDIRIEMANTNGEVVAKVTDFDAPRFDPLTEGPPPGIERQLEQRVPGGLGIHLVKKMMDHIEYSHQDRTATVTLRKRAT